MPVVDRAPVASEPPVLGAPFRGTTRRDMPWWEVDGINVGNINYTVSLGVKALLRMAAHDGKTLHTLTNYFDVGPAHEFGAVIGELRTAMGGPCLQREHEVWPEVKDPGHYLDSEVRSWGRGIAILHSDPRDRKLFLSLATLDQSVMDAVLSLVRTKCVKKPPRKRGEVKTIKKTKEGYELTTAGMISAPIMRGNYASEVLEAYDAIASELVADVPRGRLAILDGPPGTGKTTLVKSLVTLVDKANFIMVPTDLVAELGRPALVDVLIQARKDSKFLVLLLEDADAVLRKRKGRQNIDGLRALLDMGDGLMGDILGLRIVATTNCPRKDLDKAVLRPGRLMRHVTIGALEGADLQAFFERELPGAAPPSTKPRTLAQAYRMVLDHRGAEPMP